MDKETKEKIRAIKVISTKTANKMAEVIGHSTIDSQEAVNRAVEETVKESLTDAGVSIADEHLYLEKEMPGLGSEYCSAEGIVLKVGGPSVAVSMSVAERILRDHGKYIKSGKRVAIENRSLSSSEK